MAYIGTTPTKVVSRQSVVDYRYTATAGQTAFTGADLNNQVLACNPADMDVRLNGVTLDLTDWTATATTLTLAVAATAGDEVTVAVRQTFEVADTYAKTTADDRFVNAAGDTMTGNLTVVSPDNSGSTNIVTAVSNNLGQSVSLTFTGLKSNAAAGIGFVVNETTGAMSIDTSGHVTMPYQPAFRAVCTASYTVGPNVDIAFGTIVNSTGGHYSTASGRFTAPIDGWYHFSFNLRYAYIGYYSYLFKKNGNVQQYYEAVGYGSGSTNHGNSHTIYLNANDYVNLSNGSQGGLASDPFASFSGYLIG